MFIMKKVLLGVCLCLLVITPIFHVKGMIITSSDYGINNHLNDEGWLEERNGVKILHISGSYYEMAYQANSLLKYESLEFIRALLYKSKQMGVPQEDLLELWKIMKQYVPEIMLQYLQGSSDALNMSLDEIGSVFMVFEKIYTGGCGVASIWGSSTASNELIHMRSLDWPLSVIDPITGKYIQENKVLVVAKPDNGYAIMYPSASCLFFTGGINEKGIATSILYSWNNDQTCYGTPVPLRHLMALFTSSTASEAIDILSTNETNGYNFIVSDGKIPIGYALETTASKMYYGTWNDSSESIRPFWSIPNVVRRTNFFISPECASEQRPRYRPSIFPFISTFLFRNRLGNTLIPAAIPWMHYIALSKGIEKLTGKMNLDNALGMLRNVYLGRTDLRFFFIQKFQAFTPLHQWVACPVTGDMFCAFAEKNKSAMKTTVHHFNLYDLLNSLPPS